MNILGTGLTGLVGSKIIELMGAIHSFEDMSLSTGCDITNYPLVETRISHSNAPWIFHFAALTDVDNAEKERDDINGLYWKVNVSATENIVSLAKKYNKRIVFLSTDYVFDGEQDTYSEDDVPNPEGWYALTKYEGEKRVLSNPGNLVIRISNPYRSNPVGKTDFVHKIVERLAIGQKISAPNDQLFAPTFIDDIAHGLDVLITNNASGIYHIVGNKSKSPYDAAVLVAKAYSLPVKYVFPIAFREYFNGRAPRPMKAVLIHDKISQFGVTMTTFEQGISLIRKEETKEDNV